MDAMKVRPGMALGGKSVRQVIDTHETVWRTVAGRQVAASTAPVRVITFTDGSVRRVRPGKSVAASGYMESLPAGTVASKVGTASRVRAHDGRWRGQSDVPAGMGVWAHDQVVRMPGWDAASINGRVGVSPSA